MESKFTPGPWFVGMKESGASANTIYQRHAEAYHDKAIASVYGLPVNTRLNDMGRWGATEDMANAHLIAAAPDLYEALSAALPYIESELDNAAYKRGAVARVVAQMNAAIAKAEGH